MMTHEEALELRDHPLWKAVHREVQKRIDSQVARLKSCAPAELTAVQDKVRVYEEMMSLPQDVIDRESGE